MRIHFFPFACGLVLSGVALGCSSLESKNAHEHDSAVAGAAADDGGGEGGMSGGSGGMTGGVGGLTGGSGGMTGGAGGITGGVGGGDGDGDGDSGPDDPCDAVDCQGDTMCVEGDCVPIEHCTSTPCGADKTCVDEICVPTCSVDDSCEVGDGCVEEADCGSSHCVSGKCHPVCRASCELGAECVNDGDCAEGNCDVASGAATGVCRPACAIGGCDTAEACTRDADCSDGDCTDDLCQPSCGTACAPGDACATSNNCAGADICDEIDHVCLTSCTNGSGDYTLTTAADFTNARFCWEIDDNLEISPNFATVTADHLPYLKDVTGALTLEGFNILDITLPRVERALGGFGCGNSTAANIHFPAMLQIGTFGSVQNTGLSLELSSAVVVDMPELESIQGNLSIYAPSLTTLHFGSLRAVQGEIIIMGSMALTTFENMLDARDDISSAITIHDVPDLPWTTIDQFVLPRRGNEDISNVGCDTASACNCGNTSCVAPPN